MEYVAIAIAVLVMAWLGRRKQLNRLCKQFGWPSYRVAKKRLGLHGRFKEKEQAIRMRGPVSYVPPAGRSI